MVQHLRLVYYIDVLFPLMIDGIPNRPLYFDQKDIKLVYYFWANYNDLTATSLEIMVSKGNHPKMALIQVSEFL